jgi:hypothetical protein
MNYKSWHEFRKRRNIFELTDEIVKGLHKLGIAEPLSGETVAFLCSFNNIRENGDQVAHNATRIEIENAVKLQKSSQDGPQLEELYRFVYNVAI